MKKQVIIIHGGDTFQTYEEWFSYLQNKEFNFERFSRDIKGWKDNLRKELGDEYEVIMPEMPNKQNAKYAEWKIWFEKLFPFLNPEVILIGHSLGGIFLAKYVSENDFPKKIVATFLVAACFDDKVSGYPLGDFSLDSDLSNFEKRGGNIFLYHSKDDPVVPFADVKEYKNALPGATERIFDNRGHFHQGELPEIIDEIKSINYLQ